MNQLYPIKPTKCIIGINEPIKLNPYSICYDEWNHHLIVSDWYYYSIQLLDPKTLTCHYMFGSPVNQNKIFDFPTGLCIQPFTRNLLVCESGKNRIQVFDTAAGNYSFLYQIGFTKTEEKGQFDDLRGICCDEKGHILAADTGNHRIQEFNESGQFLSLFGSFSNLLNEFNFPQDICYDKEHRELLVADSFNKRVCLWSHDSSSKPQCISQIQLKDLCNSICMDPLRNRQILIGTLCNVFVYDSRNYKEPIQTLGTNKVGSGLGEFHIVSGLCVNEQDGTLIIVDRWNQRIQVF